MSLYHLETSAPGTALCGEAKVPGINLVDRPGRVDCPACRRAAKFAPLPRVGIARFPPRDVVLKELLEVLCKVMPGDRHALAHEALLILEGAK